MEKEISLDEYKKAYREIRRGEERRGFFVHLAVYVLVNAMLNNHQSPVFSKDNLVFLPTHRLGNRYINTLLVWGSLVRENT